MVPAYWAVSVIVVTGVSPRAGGVTPGMAAMSIRAGSAAPVAGNTAATVPVFAAFVAVAPATVKPFAATPVNVHPAFAVSVMFAVYAVVAANGLSPGVQVIVPVY